jgi:hypothetical protein
LRFSRNRSGAPPKGGKEGEEDPMNKNTLSMGAAEQRRALKAAEDAIAAQNALLDATHAALDPRHQVPVDARARRHFEELCTPPERRKAVAAAEFNEWEAIRC